MILDGLGAVLGGLSVTIGSSWWFRGGSKRFLGGS